MLEADKEIPRGDIQSDVTGKAAGDFVGYLIAFVIVENEPWRSTNHRFKRKTRRITRWITRSTLANNLLRKISSGTKRQLTVHLYRNTREKSKAPVRYSQGCSRKNGRPRKPCKAKIVATCPVVAKRPLCLHVTTMRPGRYNIFDIFTDRAPLRRMSVSHESPNRAYTRTHA